MTTTSDFFAPFVLIPHFVPNSSRRRALFDASREFAARAGAKIKALAEE